MDISVVLWVVFAVGLFWSVGLYNRLMRIRARAIAALRSVEKHMRYCMKLAQLHISQMQDSPNPEQSQLMENLHLLDQALKDVRGLPLARQSVARVGQLFEATQSVWFAQYANSNAPGSDGPPKAVREQWDLASAKAQTARAGLNTILFKYNEAVYQYPARLIVGVLGFKPAGPM